MIDAKKIKNSIGQFILVFIIFGGAWYYVEQQRIHNSEIEKNAYKMKLDAESALLQAKELEERIEIEKTNLSNSIAEYSKDKELYELTIKFINEVSEIDFHQECGDDPEHNKKARKAKALLQLIEAKAQEHDKVEILELFVKRQNLGISGWAAECNP